VGQKGDHQASLSLKTPFWTLAAIVLVLSSLSGFSLWRATQEANLVDRERTGTAVAAAITDRAKRLEAMTDDNARWDDAAKAVYRPKIDTVFTHGVWGQSSGVNGYDIVFGFDDSGALLFAFAGGKESSVDYLTYFGADLKALTKGLNGTTQSTSGIAQSKFGRYLVATATIRPIDPTLARLTTGRPKVTLAFARKIDGALLAEVEAALALKSLRATVRPGDDSISISSAGKASLFSLSWEPQYTAYKAVNRTLPIMALGLFIALIAVVALCRYGMRFVANLDEMAMLDSLSGLPNRRALRADMHRRLRAGEHLAVAFIDLDGFKAINDNYGHSVGDDLIRECARAATEIAEHYGIVARLGGDEFAIMVAGPRAERDLEQCIARLLNRLAKPFRLGERTIMIGASAGLASSSLGDISASEVMRKADIAMYASKRTGKMRLTWFDNALDLRQSQMHAIENRIRIALDDDQFEVHYQPLVDARTHKIVAVEALLRWNDPNHAPIGPAEFVPVAEETGLIDRLGLFVLRRACRDAMAWPDVTLSVNVSAAQLRNPDFPALLKTTLDESGLPAERLELEVTETYVVLDPDVAKAVLAEIQALGVKVALDDFGTGYASIGFLRNFNFEKLKIDRSLVADSLTDEGARAMLHASVAVARALGMSVVAEGIENEDQASLMRIAGCDQLQGWLFSYAIEVGAMTQMVAPPKDSNVVRLDGRMVA
jgi:diguanylate cyclase (GGDEF)-like protein